MLVFVNFWTWFIRGQGERDTHLLWYIYKFIDSSLLIDVENLMVFL